MDFPTICSLLTEIDEFQKARELLDKVYLEIGPYQEGKLTKETWYRVRDYFKFNDSE